MGVWTTTPRRKNGLNLLDSESISGGFHTAPT
jgi:hypothetical protein